MASFSRRSLLAGSAASLLAQTAGPVRLGRPVRVGIIGLEGHTGEILTPLPRFPDVKVVAVAHRNDAALKQFTARPALKEARAYSDYRDMLDAGGIDIAAICNHNGERAQAILDSVSRGIHVIAEKPLAITIEDLGKIKKSVAEHRVGLSMLLPMRFSSPYLALKKVVDSGEIGEVAQLAAQKSYKLGNRPDWFRDRSTYGSTMLWIGPHMVDLMRWTSGREFRDVACFESRVGHPELRDMENVSASIFRLDNGGAAALRMDYFRPESAPSHGDDRLRIAGLKGVAEYSPLSGVSVISDAGPGRIISDLPPDESVFADFLLDLYKGKARSLTLADCYRVTEIVLLAHSAAREGRVVAM